MLTKFRTMAALSAVGMASLFLLPAGIAGAANGATLSVGAVQSVANMATVDGIACPTASTCYGLGYNSLGNGSAYIVPITNGVAGTPIAVPAAQQLLAIACASATTCYAIGVSSSSTFGDGVLVPITNGAVGTPLPVLKDGEWYGIACQTALTCIAVGPDGVLPIVSGVPTTPVSVPSDVILSAVSCKSTTSCLATGSVTGNDREPQAILVNITADLPQSAVLAGLGDPSNLMGVDCVSSTLCLAVGYSTNDAGGVVLPVSTSILPPVDVASVDNLYSIACSGPTDCVASGEVSNVGATLVPIDNQVAGTVTQVAGVFQIESMACPSVTSCIAVGYGTNGGVVVPMTVVPPVSVTTTSLPEAQLGTGYSQTLSATGGTTPYTWSLASGTLPPGLTLSPAGTITGVPAAGGTFNFSAEVTDSSDPQQTATAPESIVVTETATEVNLLQEILNLIVHLLNLPPIRL